MYGLLVENLASFIRIQWGEGKWDMVRKSAGIDAPSFSIHHVYPETLLTRLAKTAFQVLGVEEKQFYEAMGIYFVEYVGQYGYDEMLTVLGRHMRDFLNGLDNLHEYLKFSYIKMRAPSFYCDNETANGLRLHYRSKRRGFVYYVMGQIKQVARRFYNQECEIAIISDVLDGETMHTIFQLTFDNNAYTEAQSLKSMIREEQQLPIRASIIFELFPFCIVFSPEMEIKFTGHALLLILKDLVGQGMTEAFELVKPMISFCFATILERRNNIFELVTVAPIKDDEALTGSFELESDDETGTSLTLRGQMMHMEEWNMILFLANPVMKDVNGLVEAGLYINDLSLHDCSRDLVLAGKQQSVELKLALDQEQQKSKHLEQSMKKLDEEIRKTDELLYQMIPKQVADRLRSGESPVDTCEVFEMVSILFSDVVTFTDICSRITPMQVVTMLNHMYSLFDQLTERNGVYKVETIGDSYMVVSGAPVFEENHAERICDMAMDMVDAMQAIVDPSRVEEPLKIRVGCHSGMVVAGVVGVKMPRYCLFGDAVNTASRMESTSVGSRIQISEGCKSRLSPPYLTELRGTVTVKGKGEMNTFWLNGRENRVPLSKVNTKSFNWNAPQSSKQKSLNAQMSKQSSILSEDMKSEAAGVVKEMTREDADAAAAVVKPTGKTPSAFAARQNFKQSIPTNFSVASDSSLSSSKITFASVVQTAVEVIPKKEDLPVPVSVPTPDTPKESLKSETMPRRPSTTNISRETVPVSDSKTATNPGKIETPKMDSEILSIPANDTMTRRPSTPRIIESEFGTTIQWENDNSTLQPQTGIVNAEVDVKSPTDSVGPDVTTITPDAKLLSPTDIPECPVITEFGNFTENGIPIPTQRRKSRLMEGIDGIRQESQQWKNKIRDKKLSGLTIDGMSDLGCSEFTAKQKEIISQACNLL